jgi:hypothetical protein
MDLQRCKDQPSKTLDEFYEEIATSDEEFNRTSGKLMLALISRLRALPDERCVWGLTSLHRLCLLAHDTYKSPWFVIVFAADPGSYSIEYLMPAAVAPWPDARVQGEARSEDEAIRMILVAMERSEGWQVPLPGSHSVER